MKWNMCVHKVSWKGPAKAGCKPEIHFYQRCFYYTLHNTCWSCTHPSGSCDSWHWVISSFFRLVSLDRVSLSLSSLLRSFHRNKSSPSDVISDMLWILFTCTVRRQNVSQIIYRFKDLCIMTWNRNGDYTLYYELSKIPQNGASYYKVHDTCWFMYSPLW